MQNAHMDPRNFQQQRHEGIWSTQILTLIASGQMLLTLVIIASETWSMFVSLKASFLFIGYVAAVFFTITWISTFTIVCCHQGSQGCKTHALVENILSVAVSSVLLYYNVQFLQNPLVCFWPSNICYGTDWSFISNSWWKNDHFGIVDDKFLAIKIQLSCAAIMIALCLVFILIYTYNTSQTRARLTVVVPQNSIECRPREPLPPQSVPVWAIQMPIWSPPTNG